MPNIYQDCLRCGREFYIKDSEQRFWEELAEKEDRELRLPKRCFGCRKERREEAEQEEIQKVWEEEDGYQRRSQSRSSGQEGGNR